MRDTYRTRLAAMCDNPKLTEAVLSLNEAWIDLHIEQHKDSGVTNTPTGTLKLLKKEITNAENN